MSPDKCDKPAAHSQNGCKVPQIREVPGAGDRQRGGDFQDAKVGEHRESEAQQWHRRDRVAIHGKGEAAGRRRTAVGLTQQSIACDSYQREAAGVAELKVHEQRCTCRVIPPLADAAAGQQNAASVCVPHRSRRPHQHREHIFRQLRQRPQSATPFCSFLAPIGSMTKPCQSSDPILKTPLPSWTPAGTIHEHGEPPFAQSKCEREPRGIRFNLLVEVTQEGGGDFQDGSGRNAATEVAIVYAHLVPEGKEEGMSVSWRRPPPAPARLPGPAAPARLLAVHASIPSKGEVPPTVRD
ncbi:hypothetical protein BDK51DRAFT_47367 [Blyttiomyces helicus]|uniref:Uncharacterized protein n=1 Tax=Blyttiomyces helicus TaxID=388810 RepID=A0A4P9W1E3_9FUNG|nr:hypothetical protein BDK51DRAFT_47367 [Blyttiomyces helicus]|eukprot:RKO85999.1 hypothetical protein BDK51DRAFT_47367 [Blyttiomyces helicus]